MPGEVRTETTYARASGRRGTFIYTVVSCDDLAYARVATRIPDYGVQKYQWMLTALAGRPIHRSATRLPGPMKTIWVPADDYLDRIKQEKARHEKATH